MDTNRMLSRVRIFLMLLVVLMVTAFLAGCGATFKGEKVDYTPLEQDDWKISTPLEQGLPSRFVDKLYKDAGELDTLYSLLVIKNGYLIAEKYYQGRSVDSKVDLASVTKSFT